jgi:hypothetical protein
MGGRLPERRKEEGGRRKEEEEEGRGGGGTRRRRRSGSRRRGMKELLLRAHRKRPATKTAGLFDYGPRVARGTVFDRCFSLQGQVKL